MARLTQDQWQEARAKWEADPALTFEALGAELGVSKQAISDKCKKENWQRTPDMKSIRERAQLKADKRELDKLDGKLDTSSTKIALEAREAAEDIRADVIERHRTDWARHRNLFGLDAIAADFDTGKSAKISAEMLAIRQKGERAAYGLDDDTGSQTIVLERSYGLKP